MLRKEGLLLAIAVTVMSMPVEKADAQSELVKLVTERQGLMFDMQTAYWALFEVNADKSTDLVKAVEGAETINEAIEMFVDLLPAGTAQGEVPGSRAKPDIWTQPGEFNDAVQALMDANTSIIESARSGNLDEFKQRFDAVARACVACHEFRPSQGGKFRYPR